MVAQTTIQSLANTPAQGYANACRALAHADLRDEIAQIQIPVLLIAGTEDPVTTVADAEFVQNAVKNSQLAKLEASHLSNIEQPQRFTQELTRFIQQI